MNEYIGIRQFFTHQTFPNPDSSKFSTIKNLRHTLYAKGLVKLIVYKLVFILYHAIFCKSEIAKIIVMLKFTSLFEHYGLSAKTAPTNLITVNNI